MKERHQKATHIDIMQSKIMNLQELPDDVEIISYQFDDAQLTKQSFMTHMAGRTVVQKGDQLWGTLNGVQVCCVIATYDPDGVEIVIPGERVCDKGEEPELSPEFAIDPSFSPEDDDDDDTSVDDVQDEG